MCAEDIVKAKKLMAFEVTKLVHGEEEALKAQETSKNIFEHGNFDNENMPTEKIKNSGEVLVVDMLAQLSIISSKSEARRLIEQGGIFVDNKKVELVTEKIDLNSKKEFVVKKGKKTYIKVIVE